MVRVLPSACLIVLVACSGSAGPADVTAPDGSPPGVAAPDRPTERDEPEPPSSPEPEPTPPGDPPVDVSSGALRTDADRYVLRFEHESWQARIPWTYDNPTDGPVFMTTCNGPHPPMLEKWNGSAWVAGWHPIHLMCLGPPLRIEVGGSHPDELWLHAGHPSSDNWPRFESAEWEGVYRLVWWPRSSYQDRPPFGDLLPLEHRVSPPFELVEGE